MDSSKSSGFWARARDWFAGVDALVLVMIFVGVPAAILLTYLYDRHDSGMSFDSESWGQLGDFLGGVLNPFVALLTVLILIRTIKQNQDVINVSREELLASREALDATLEELKVSRIVQAKTEDALRKQNEMAALSNDHQLINHLIDRWERRKGAVKIKLDSARQRYLQLVGELAGKVPSDRSSEAINDYLVSAKFELKACRQSYRDVARRLETIQHIADMAGDELIARRQANLPADASSPTQ